MQGVIKQEQVHDGQVFKGYGKRELAKRYNMYEEKETNNLTNSRHYIRHASYPPGAVV